MICRTIVCQSTRILYSKSWTRVFSSLKQRQDDHSTKAKELFLGPNITESLEKLKKGDFIPAFVQTDLPQEEPRQATSHPSMGSSREQLREKTLGKLVYIGKLDRSFRAAKSLSLASSIGGAICYPIMLPRILHETSMYLAIGYTIISATFVLLTPSLIQLICKRYLTSLYYNEQSGQFTGFYKNFFMMERQIRFRSEDVEVPPVTGVFTSMLIRKQPFFINHDDFDDKTILRKMLGYDKEFDFDKYTKDLSNERTKTS